MKPPERTPKWQTEIRETDMTEDESAEGLVLRPVGSHQTNPFAPKPPEPPVEEE